MERHAFIDAAGRTWRFVGQPKAAAARGDRERQPKGLGEADVSMFQQRTPVAVHAHAPTTDAKTTLPRPRSAWIMFTGLIVSGVALVFALGWWHGSQTLHPETLVVAGAASAQARTVAPRTVRSLAPPSELQSEPEPKAPPPTPAEGPVAVRLFPPTAPAARAVPRKAPTAARVYVPTCL